MLDLPPGKGGVLPNQHIEKAISSGAISAPDDVPAANIQPASLDLRLGSVAHRIQCSFLPGSHTVEERLGELTQLELEILQDGDIGGLNGILLGAAAEQGLLARAVHHPMTQLVPDREAPARWPQACFLGVDPDLSARRQQQS